jgi:hypothetical protein
MSTSIPPPLTAVPPLQSGDHLTADEFERRYEAMPELKKAELIEGVVYVPSPVRSDHHGEPHADLMTWLGVYRASTPGVRVTDNATLRLDMGNRPQPDAAAYVDPARGGQARLDADGYLAGGPELTAEVAASSATIALNTKFSAYQRNNVREYIVWRVLDQAVDWFVLRQGQFEALALTGGLYRSEVFPGLWLDPAALVRLDLAAVLQTLQQGLASPEHSAFVQRLRSSAGSS